MIQRPNLRIFGVEEAEIQTKAQKTESMKLQEKIPQI
jgi:hypothetical protein